MPIITYPGTQLTGSGIIDMVKDGQTQFECIKALCKKYPTAAALTAMDLSVEAEAFGSPVRFSDKEAPNVTSAIVHDMDSVNALKIPAVGAGRTGEYLKAAKLATKEITDRPVFGGVIGPFSLAGRLLDMNRIVVSVRRNPEMVHRLLEKCMAFITDYVKAFKEAGTNGVIMAEPAAGLLSPALCQEFSSDYIRKLVDEVQDEHFIIVLHNCGHVEKLVPSMLSTGCRAFHFGNAVDMTAVMPQMPWGTLAFGNIDPSNVMKLGTPDKVKEKTLELLEKTAVYKNYVLSTGCDIPPGTPVENIDAFFEALSTFNNYIAVGEIA